ncbi:hypothetical protein FH972_021913 [Carpinus fangiana]|uniref:Large ribosomal subunit protein mL50 n=1 Tax=Carpinus fangiana TaxID=176857 RepID=A0A5N6KRC7_9ROSI|nr:hypothetical protein FH972_021913 [Carpinus fangiana]
MRRGSRLLRQRDRIQCSVLSSRQSSSSPVCLFCQQWFPAARVNLSTTSTRHQPDFLERTRRRIWGTDKPPGADDPYTGLSRPKTFNRAGTKERVLTMERDEDHSDQDAGLYEKQALREARELYQQSVDIAPEHDEYVPANSWDGLEMVGGEKDWDSGEMFQGFKPLQRLDSPEEITMAIYRATVEVLLAASAEEPLTDLAKPQTGVLVTAAKDVIIRVEDGRVRLEFPSEEVIRDLVASIRGQRGFEDMASLDASTDKNYTPESLRHDVQSLGRQWLHVPLTDTSIKFAIVRRVIQLTGIHVPDHIINDVRSISLFVSKLAVPPRPEMLADELQTSVLSSLRNVRLMQRRETPIDRERREGRWKVIEEELVHRDLPVVGRW